MRCLTVIGLTILAAAGGCRTAEESDVRATEYEAGAREPVNCGAFDATYNAAHGIGKLCWADAADPAARCFVEEADGSRVDVACDDTTVFACVGGLGSGCGLHGASIADLPCTPGPDPKRPWDMQCIVAVGSILHDACCAEANAKHQAASGCMGNWGIVPGRRCDDVWQEASFDRARGFYWWKTFDTRRRFRGDDVRVRGVDAGYTMGRLGIKAPSGTALGGTRYGILPNAEDAAWALLLLNRSTERWGSFCESGKLSGTVGSWVQGVAYCQ